MLYAPTKIELKDRMKKFIALMDKECPDWNSAAITSNVSQYYFLSTIQDGILLIRRSGEYSYYARTSFKRAQLESPLENIFPMRSYRDITEREPKELGVLYIEGESIPYEKAQRLYKYFAIEQIKSLDLQLREARAIKSEYEQSLMRASGIAHKIFLTEKVPEMLREGMSESDFFAEAFMAMISLGYQGVSRFSKSSTEMQFGQFGFGVNSLYPTNFDGPNGMKAYAASVPVGGDPDRKLKKGDAVFVDIAFGINGYHTDKTQVYLFGAKPSEEMAKIQQSCRNVQDKAQSLMKDGALPSDVYNNSISILSDSERKGFMGYEDKTVKFLGHGIGLYVDESPIIAEGFNDPLKTGMAIAIEPKKGLKGVGMLGCEETFLIMPDGAECITGGNNPIIEV